MQTRYTRTSAALLALLASAAFLAGCDRNDNRTVGQRVDEVVAATERKAGEIGAESREAGREVRQAVGEAADSASDKARDMAITAEVNTRLARDDQLSALKIDVDTSAGHVVLRGTAPDTQSRNRAALLAQGANGVVSVENELTVQPRQ